ncbi:MAG: hypothetical protein ACXVAE_01535 [Candidatus Limnocylindrales bacterium]
MARAKRTDRAEARRRYRATQSATADEGTDIESDEATPAAGALKSSAPVGSAARRRAGLFGTLDIHPPDLRGDLAALPAVVRATPLLWFAFALALAGLVLAAVAPIPPEGLLYFLVQLLVLFPTPALVAGFVAPRGAYLLGLPLGILQGMAAGLFVIRLAAAETPPVQVPTDVLLTNAGLAVVQGVVFAALAAWYRRWLRQMSERNAAARAAREKQQKRDAKRPAGGTRPAR